MAGLLRKRHGADTIDRVFVTDFIRFKNRDRKLALCTLDREPLENLDFTVQWREVYRAHSAYSPKYCSYQTEGPTRSHIVQPLNRNLAASKDELAIRSIVGIEVEADIVLFTLCWCAQKANKPLAMQRESGIWECLQATDEASKLHKFRYNETVD